MHIDFLAEHVELIPTIAEWLYDEWGDIRPGDSVDRRIEQLEGLLNRDRIPTAVIGLSGAVPVGIACLVEHDLPGREDLAPWLASVVVPPELRRQGIGKALVERVVEIAGELGHDELYLFTFDQEHFYAEMGWQTFDKAERFGQDITLMQIATGSA